jgi:two-component system, chemotaxis family, chemotaxis protein CheY
VKILIVDDTVAHRLLLREILGKAGHQVVGEAGSGLEAVSMFRATSPDLVLMDLVMPHLNGIEATKEIIAIEPGAKIIALSGLAQPSVQAEVMGAGALAFVTKPIEARDLLAEIAGI